MSFPVRLWLKVAEICVKVRSLFLDGGNGTCTFLRSRNKYSNFRLGWFFVLVWGWFFLCSSYCAISSNSLLQWQITKGMSLYNVLQSLCRQVMQASGCQSRRGTLSIALFNKSGVNNPNDARCIFKYFFGCSLARTERLEQYSFTFLSSGNKLSLQLKNLC